jgi:hypothetical protein
MRKQEFFIKYAPKLFNFIHRCDLIQPPIFNTNITANATPFLPHNTRQMEFIVERHLKIIGGDPPTPQPPNNELIYDHIHYCMVQNLPQNLLLLMHCWSCGSLLLWISNVHRRLHKNPHSILSWRSPIQNMPSPIFSPISILFTPSPNLRINLSRGIFSWSFCMHLSFLRPPLWSSSQSFWLDSQRFQIFWEAAGLERGPISLVRTTEELLGRNSSGSGLENVD